MSYEETTRVELENTIRKLLAGKSAAGRPAATEDSPRPEPPAPTPMDPEKTIHDIRAALNVIIGFSELMRDGAMGKINQEQHSTLTDILNSGKRLANLSEELFKRLDVAPGDKYKPAAARFLK
ncbi:MAG: histidine kinase dimerization/phospho-acceptor domain-containing protein [Dehalococcoidales bacterium]|jgi:signal transduction histidine kinase